MSMSSSDDCFQNNILRTTIQYRFNVHGSQRYLIGGLQDQSKDQTRHVTSQRVGRRRHPLGQLARVRSGAGERPGRRYAVPKKMVP